MAPFLALLKINLRIEVGLSIYTRASAEIGASTVLRDVPAHEQP